MNRETAPNILIIDDSPVVTSALATILEQEGYRTAVFGCGSDALDYARENCPAAAIVDIHLPDISGLTLATRLRKRFGEELPIIILSGDTSMENIRSLSVVGATCFFGKPFRPDHLLDRLKELVGQGVPSRG